MMRAFCLAPLLLATASCGASPKIFKATDAASPLQLRQIIPLADVSGRIDHLAVDVPGRRLFVAEVANGSVDVVDLASARVTGRISGLKEPQGIAWLEDRHEIVVACGDGSVHFYDGTTRKEVASFLLGNDADNVRVDPRNGHVVVGYGSGALATIDPANRRVVSRTPFKGHPEGFRLLEGHAFVNVPDDGVILSIDLDAGRVLARWPTGTHRLNFPMALASDGASIMIGYRLPAALAKIDTRSGADLSGQATCGDTDDLFLIGDRTLVICGAGHIDLVRGASTVARIETGGGARTGLYVPELRSLFVALPSRGKPAAIWRLELH